MGDEVGQVGGTEGDVDVGPTALRTDISGPDLAPHQTPRPVGAHEVVRRDGPADSCGVLQRHRDRLGARGDVDAAPAEQQRHRRRSVDAAAQHLLEDGLGDLLTGLGDEV